jgi:tRNA uridine 5-carbamoylmethylation protein Kti12
MQSDVTSDGQRLLIVLCGLPGAGKSSFARALQTSTVGNFPPPNSTLHHVCFDELYADTSNAAASFDRNAWHESRRVAFDKTTELLQLPIATSSHQIIVVDDNMHLRSMRKPFMQLARKCILLSAFALIVVPSIHMFSIQIILVISLHTSMCHSTRRWN